MGIHAGRPWRAVVHIDDAVPGDHGGEAWMLTLSCGHLAFRSKPKRRLSDIALFVRAGLRKLTAPHRVRCLHCEPEEN